VNTKQRGFPFKKTDIFIVVFEVAVLCIVVFNFLLS
jgi:hypothetical protein